MLVLFFFSLIASSVAQFLGLSKCAFIQPMPNFQINNFTGRWYEIERTDNSWQIFESCTIIDYVFNRNNNTLDIHGHVINTETGARQHWDGVGLVDPNNPASMVVQLPPLAQVEMANYNIVDTDYRNYLVAVQCVTRGLSPPNGWLLSRRRDLDQRYISRGEQILRENGVSMLTLITNDQRNCQN
ncbi:apolipoprotein D-like [Cotesia typhae]|uniref:apolipoprotein D-like n=1 Tax=Cotesia typhae TaxID=2053667 RepID=UPI003D68A664